MGRLKRVLTMLTGSADERIDRARRRLRARQPASDRLAIAPYAGYGTLERLTIQGRVLEAVPIPRAVEGESWRTHLRYMVRRLESDEVPGALVRARSGGASTDMRSDDEGYFRIALEPVDALEPDRVWHDVSLELVEPTPLSGARATATGRILVPPPSARFGIISDIDDTVIWTNVTSKLKMAKTVFFDGVRSRLPLEGVSALYRALQCGVGGAEANPIFYVSGSPWNLYDLLTEIFQHHGIPEGPIQLRDFGTTRDSMFWMDTVEHKLSQIRALLETYPSLPFILIGDSGEKDPEIYQSIVEEFPGRILAVYIRSMTSHEERARAIAALAEKARAVGSDLVLAHDSRLIAEHAAAQGWILDRALEPVERAARRDKAAPSPVPTPPVESLPPEEVIRS